MSNIRSNVLTIVAGTVQLTYQLPPDSIVRPIVIVMALGIASFMAAIELIEAVGRKKDG